MTAGHEARIVPLRRGICFACVIVWVVAPTFTGAGIVWAVFAWIAS